MDSPDIESGEYVCPFDENGTVFSIETAGTKKSFLGIIPSPGILKPTGENASSKLYELLQERLGKKMRKVPLH